MIPLFIYDSLKTFQDYFDYVVGDTGGEELIQLLDQISTNKTDFFREPKHFYFLREKILPGLNGGKKVRIWSSACSSGEEPYTIAMTLMDGVSYPDKWDFKILASDLSTQILEAASSGIYSKDRVKDLSPHVVRRHFFKGKGKNEGTIKIKPHLSEKILFKRINLMDERFPIKSSLDVIFCRNVMIYFDKPTMECLIDKFYRFLKSEGYLFIGHSESLQWIKTSFRCVEPTIYCK